jgi:hypothetical protein
MGATSALLAASVSAENPAVPIGAVVAENPFSAVEDLLSHVIDQVMLRGSLADKVCTVQLGFLLGGTHVCAGRQVVWVLCALHCRVSRRAASLASQACHSVCPF